jgi:hypothetical protein
VVFHDARGWYLATSVTGRRVATRAVLTATDEHHGDDQQNHDDDDDPKHLYPAWRAGIGRPVSHVRLLSSRVVIEAIVTAKVYDDKLSMSIQNVYTESRVSQLCRHGILG